MFCYVNKKRIGEFLSEGKLGMTLAFLDTHIEFKHLTSDLVVCQDTGV